MDDKFHYGAALMMITGSCSRALWELSVPVNRFWPACTLPGNHDGIVVLAGWHVMLHLGALITSSSGESEITLLTLAMK